MTDRELLDAAAKAAGYQLEPEPASVWVIGEDPLSRVRLNEQGGHSIWNPLADDGDALRLAVKLQLQLDLRNPETHVFGPPSGRIDEYHAAGDPYAATRRAIVRAAAALEVAP